MSAETIQEKLELAFAGRDEIEVHRGLTIVRCETLGKFFVRETYERLEDLPASVIGEIEDFLEKGE